MEIDEQKLGWVFEAEPQKYANKEYIIYSCDFGKYTKKEADIICDFLRNNFTKIIYKSRVIK
jgi:hypothetical protein